MGDHVKNIMLNMYPKRKSPIPSNIEDEDIQMPHPMEIETTTEGISGSKMADKWIFSLCIAGISVFLFSSFFLDFVDDVCMKRDTTAFNTKGEPSIKLIAVIFTIILLISRTFFSLV